MVHVSRFADQVLSRTGGRGHRVRDGDLGCLAFLGVDMGAGVVDREGLTLHNVFAGIYDGQLRCLLLEAVQTSALAAEDALRRQRLLWISIIGVDGWILAGSLHHQLLRVAVGDCFGVHDGLVNPRLV